MKNYLKTISSPLFIALALCIFLSCNSDDPENYENDPNTEYAGEVTLYIKHYQVTGNGLEQSLLPLISINNNDNYLRSFDGIRNFSIELGFDYIIEADIYNYIETPQDAGSSFYVYRELISQIPGDTSEEFEVFLKYNSQGEIQNDFLRLDANGNYSLLGQINITCNEICDLLETPLNNTEGLFATFTRNENNDYVLVSTRIQQ